MASLVVLLGLATTAAQAQLVVDQTQNSPHLLASGGLAGAVMQAFVPGYNNVAGVDMLLVGTGALTGSVSVQIERVSLRAGEVGYIDAYGNRGIYLGQIADIQVLAQAQALDVARGDYGSRLVPLRWSPVAVTPGETLYLRIVSQGLLTGTFQGLEGYTPTNALSLQTTPASATISHAFVDGGFYSAIGQTAYDLSFTTYASLSPVPEPGAAALLAAGLGLLAWRRRPQT